MSETIVIVDDDPEDRDLLEDAAKELFMDNPIKSFGEAEIALQFLKDTSVQPLFILCDVNMPRMGGIEFRQAIFDDEALRYKCIPFLFLSTSSDLFLIKQAYRLAVQGFFMKPASYAANI